MSKTLAVVTPKWNRVGAKILETSYVFEDIVLSKNLQAKLTKTFIVQALNQIILYQKNSVCKR